MLIDSLPGGILLSAAFASGGLAVLCWPSAAPGLRLASVLSMGHRFPVWRIRVCRRHAAVVAAPILLVSAVLALGPVVMIALALLTGAGWWHWRTRARARAKVAVFGDLSVAVRTMVGELRAGSHPAMAAEAAAADAAQDTARTLRAIAASARLGGDLDPRSAPGELQRDTGEVLARLATAWALTRTHGVPLADVLEAVERDVESTVRLAKQVDARMAGPRASACILALLPLGGIALGEAMGAEPLRVLMTTSPGQALLVVGAALVLAGIAWSAALTGRVAFR